MRTKLLTASLATAVLAGGMYLGLAHFHDAPTPGRAVAAPDPSTPAPSMEPSRPPEPLSRAQERSPAPSPTRAGKTDSCGASFYDEPQGTASGEVFDPEALTAAHKTLPFNTRVRVTNPATGKSVTVRINDRGPYIDGRCLDLSRAAFRTIADLNQGILKLVNYEILP